MALQDKQINLTLLIRIQTNLNTYNYTTLDIPIYYNSEKYNSRMAEITDISQTVANEVSELSFTLDNTDNNFDNIANTQEIRGSKVDIYLAELDTNFKVNDIILLFSGYIDTYQITKENIEITLTDELVFWNKTTLRQHDYDLFPNLKDIEEKPLLWGRNSLGGG